MHWYTNVQMNAIRIILYICLRSVIWIGLDLEKLTHDQLWHIREQESPAIADKPARRESLPKIAPIRRAYNVVADNTGLSSCV